LQRLPIHLNSSHCESTLCVFFISSANFSPRFLKKSVNTSLGLVSCVTLATVTSHEATSTRLNALLAQLRFQHDQDKKNAKGWFEISFSSQGPVLCRCVLMMMFYGVRIFGDERFDAATDRRLETFN